jgi:hypothetical protein
MAQPQPELFDLYRTGFKSALDWMQTSLENAERLQKQQLTAFRSESAGALDTGRQKTERR